MSVSASKCRSRCEWSRSTIVGETRVIHGEIRQKHRSDEVHALPFCEAAARVMKTVASARHGAPRVIPAEPSECDSANHCRDARFP